MLSSLFSFLIIAGLMLTGVTSTVSGPVIGTEPALTPAITQPAPAIQSAPETALTRSSFELKEMRDESAAQTDGPTLIDGQAQTGNDFPTPDSPWIPTGLTGENIVSAKVEKSTYGTYYVLVTFDSAGKRLFSEITTRNIGKPVGIFVDNTLISAPYVNDAITGGSAQITGNYTYEEAKQLADRLNGGI